MGYNTLLQINNSDLSAANADHNANHTALQDVLAMVNDMPVTSSGSVATCTVQAAPDTCEGSVLYNSAFGPQQAEWTSGTTLGGVLCNTFLSFRSPDGFDGQVYGGTYLELNGRAMLVGIEGEDGDIIEIGVY